MTCPRRVQVNTKVNTQISCRVGACRQVGLRPICSQSFCVTLILCHADTYTSMCQNIQDFTPARQWLDRKNDGRIADMPSELLGRNDVSTITEML